MTDIQNKYWALQETKRANRAQESLKSSEIGETRRHNVATEELTASDISEKVRHNLATEDVQIGTLKENQRHNKATESIQSMQASASMMQARASQSQAETASLKAASEIALNKQRTTTEFYKSHISASQALGEDARTNEAILNAQMAQTKADFLKAEKVVGMASAIMDIG